MSQLATEVESNCAEESAHIAPEAAAALGEVTLAPVIEFPVAARDEISQKEDSMMWSIEHMDLTKPGNQATQAAVRWFIKSSRYAYASTAERAQMDSRR